MPFMAMRRRKPFTPASLFAASEQGAWYEPDSPYQILNRRNLLLNTGYETGLYTNGLQGYTTITTIAWGGFTKAVVFGDNTLTRYAYDTFTTTAGQRYTISVHVKMDDGFAPTPGTSTSTGDFGLVIAAGLVDVAPTVTDLGGGVYRVSSSQVSPAGGGYNGVVKYTGQSARTFQVTGYQLDLGSVATAYQAITDWTTEYSAANAGRITMYQDSAGTILVTAVEQPVGKWLDKSGRGNHLTQATSAARPVLSARKNMLLATTTLATQSVTLAAVAHTLSFTGAGTVTLSGASTAGPLAGGGSLTFTPTAGSVTFTVSGSVTLAQLEPGSVVTAYQRINTATDYDAVGFPHYLAGDGVDDFMDSAAGIVFSVTYYTGVALAITGGGTNPGPFRILRSGGSATASTDNLLEEYTNSPPIKSVVQRYPSVQALTNTVSCRPGFSRPHVSWNNNGGTGASRHGVIYAASPNGDLAASAPTLTAATGGTLSLFRGNAGNFMKGRIYGFVYVGPRAVNAVELALTNQYLMDASGVTT